MSKTDSDLVAVDRDIAWVEKRIAELETLLSDPRHDASPAVLRLLLAEWRDRLRSLHVRRGELLRAAGNSSSVPAPRKAGA